ncbi:hypothetical protein D9Q98_001173 [Chlorella vulgaris]|uniref:Uncharacterized protein n=1 Tax=Chlorella vulgaris TaxID=3077 RepID=A0A9D4TZB2_CHLVU|nr:hypothetical protein D9Q98_001173 [Chlorella vulgaris]
MNTSEVQQQAYLQAAAAAQQVAEEAASAGGEQLSHDDRVEEPDFYESTQDFAPDRQLVLRSAWLCAGATSLAGMRARLQQRISFLEDLEEDGWQLEAPVDGEFACLLNTSPKPVEQRRLAEAWAIVEAWEVSGTDLEGWPGTST